MGKLLMLARGTRIRTEEFGGILMAPIKSALLTGQTFYILTELEYEVLSKCREECDILDIVAHVAVMYDVDLESVHGDISDYLFELAAVGIVEFIDRPSVKGVV